MFDLYIGNKNYSSWSLRPWLLMRHLDITFSEHQVSVSGRGPHPDHQSYSGNRLVPCLHDDGFQVWESIAIMEYLAERYPAAWPADAKARARARSIAAEMHAGFSSLRTAMPMNLKLRLQGKPASAEVQRDIDRIVELWSEARSEFAGDRGPWLFGAYSAADAMYAPIACRFDIYNVSLPPLAATYRDTVLADTFLQAWRADALKESEAHTHYDAKTAEYGGPR